VKYIFGPVLSRRLGISLGIDLLPFKTCSMDCIYCECGCSTRVTVKREEFFPTEEIIFELNAYLSDNPKIDFVTFSGSGEPTLHSGIGKVIHFINERYPSYHVAVLTNGTLLHEKQVRDDIAGADIIIPSLDGATKKSFERICRPAQGITYRKVIDGIKNLRKEFAGTLVVEIFIIPGINDSSEEIQALRDACLEIGPDAVQLNSLSRPGCVDWIEKPKVERLNEIKELMHPLIVQIVEENVRETKSNGFYSDIRGDIMSVLDRRAATIFDIALTLGIGRGEAEKTVRKMLSEDIIELFKNGDIDFFRKKVIS
jgi:wyosine [tRNA(Phe)-imidazoG37] synthetase (radical SAM superfamily)